MGGGCFCTKKWKMEGVFFCKRSGKWGCFVKNGAFLNAGCIVPVFFILHFTYFFFGGGAYAPNSTPCLRACTGRNEIVESKNLCNQVNRANT